MRLVSRSGLIASALAIGAIAAPSAQAGLFSGSAPDPPGAAQQEAQGFQRIYDRTAANTAPVSASASSVATPDPATVARDQAGDRQLSAALLRIAQIYGRNIAPTTTPAVTTAPSPGFQYGDAAVGAGLIAGLALLGLAGTLAVRRRGQLRHQ